MSKTNPNNGAALETVTLIMPHTHAGKELPIGAAITVSLAQKTWLAERGIIQTEQENEHEATDD